MTHYEGSLVAPQGRLAIVVARYNESITSKLLDGAMHSLTENGVDTKTIDVAWVPGAFEIPVVAERMAGSGNYLAVICLGAVIQGETPHDEHINRAVSLSLVEIALRHNLPVMFGILTCRSLEQAIHRSGGNVGNKGTDCAEAALRMVDLLGKLPGSAAS